MCLFLSVFVFDDLNRRTDFDPPVPALTHPQAIQLRSPRYTEWLGDEFTERRLHAPESTAQGQLTCIGSTLVVL
jgi:hypothetical protein